MTAAWPVTLRWRRAILTGRTRLTRAQYAHLAAFIQRTHASPSELPEHAAIDDADPVGLFGPPHGLTPVQAWLTQRRYNRLQAHRPLTGFPHALRIAGIVSAVKGGRVGNRAFGRSLHGVREAIWLYEDKILDGRHRARACCDLGVSCPTRLYEGDDPLHFMLSLNLHRRHLTDSQRAMIAAKLANMRVGQPKKNSSDVTDKPTVTVSEPAKMSLQQPADALHVGRTTVMKAKAILRHGSPEMIRAVETGQMSVNKAYESVRPSAGDRDGSRDAESSDDEAVHPDDLVLTQDDSDEIHETTPGEE